MATAFPINLSTMHQFIFEDLDLEYRAFNLLCAVTHSCIFFGLLLSYAKFSVKIHKMCSNLSRLQWEVSGYAFGLRTKLKLLMCFERLSSRKKIGVAIGGTVLTFPLFMKVIKYERRSVLHNQ